MPRVKLDAPAPAFSMVDYQGRERSLAELRGRPVVLVFNRGFA
ncbi:MAG: redoxin domain-containing protein [Thermoanaerobaculaceae bacterium]|jgi:peroxiredoxin|nr:redoxin domain-containing protein [Thermoanaerobaculaceae bacterium]